MKAWNEKRSLQRKALRLQANAIKQIVNLTPERPLSIIDRTMTAITILLNDLGEGNTAPIPFALALENREEGPTWTIDIHIRIQDSPEITLFKQDESLANALTYMVRALYETINPHSSQGQANESGAPPGQGEEREIT